MAASESAKAAARAWYKRLNKKSQRYQDYIEHQRDNQKRNLRARKTYLVTLAGGKCIKCGYSKSIAALQFHHINPDEKECRVTGGSLEAALKEIKKCILLCANCHFELHEELGDS